MKTSEIKNGVIKHSTSLMITMLPLLSMLMAVVPSVLHHSSVKDTIKIGILTLLLTSIVVFYIRINAENFLRKKLVLTVISFGYLTSIWLLLFAPNPEIFSFWMIGGLLVAMLIDTKLGLLIHVTLSFLMGIAVTMSLETTLQLLIIGGVMCLLAGALRQKSTVIYATIIILSTDITVAFVIHNFVFNTASNYNYFKSLISIFTVLVTAFFLSLIYNQSEMKKSVENNSLSLNPASLSEMELKKEVISVAAEQAVGSMELHFVTPVEELEFTDIQLSHATRTSYEVLCDLDNELLRKLKQNSEILYAHAVRIGNLSYRAALEIGANEMLALAGGLYHEVGKINGKNYIEEGLIIAEDYAFPKELKAILKEHNIKYEKPGSVEAAIVMLSDNIVATIDYIEKNDEKKFSSNKIIENILQMRMDKGSLDSSSLSLMDYKKLKEFYQKEFAKTK